MCIVHGDDCVSVSSTIDNDYLGSSAMRTILWVYQLAMAVIAIVRHLCLRLFLYQP